FFVNIVRGSKARLKMFNMLGSEVKDVPLAENTRSSVKVNVSDLHAGLYFYSLYINGKSTLTGKLTVTSN
ncbi:MAG: T9SS type A sorting domain-containing protein, partial [Bacteroidota bacterium]